MSNVLSKDEGDMSNFTEHVKVLRILNIGGTSSPQYKRIFFTILAPSFVHRCSSHSTYSIRDMVYVGNHGNVISDIKE